MLEPSTLRLHHRKPSFVWAVLAGALLTLFPAGAARATHETIAVDGNLADLIAAIGRNTGSANGGFALPDPQAEIYTTTCRYVNGYDVRNYYFFLDFKTSTGGTASNVRLYGGWDTYGIIGDVDGDGNASTFNASGPGAGCALQEHPGIGPLESYTVEFDFNCDAIIDVRISVKDGRVQQILPTVVDLTGRAAFATNNGFLEMRVDNFQDLVPEGLDLCNARIRMTANAELDALGEDRSSTIDLLIPPSVAVTKLPATQNVCPSDEVVWTIDVVNDGLCHLDDVLAVDVLSAGLTFASSTPTRARGDAQRSEWDFTDLEPGERQTIVLRARVAAACTSPLQNTMTIEARHIPPAACGVPDQSASDIATATLTCAPCVGVECDITLTPGPVVCAGSPAELCGPIGDFTYLWTLPSGATVTTRCVTIPSATPAHSGGYALRVTGAGGVFDTCSTKLTVVSVPCSIEGPSTVCTGAPLTLCGPVGPYTYRWTRPDGTTVTTADRCITFSTPTGGVYTLVVTDPSGCSSTPCTKVVTLTKRPQCVIAGPTTACPGTPVQFCGPLGPYTYLWTLPDGSTRTGQCITVDNPFPGPYRLVVTEPGTGCVSDPCIANLTLLPRPVCSVAGPDTLCPDVPAEFCGPVGNFSYAWFLPDGSTRAGRCITVANPAPGQYRLVVTDLTTGCKSDTCFRDLKIRKRPPCAIAGPEAVCVGQAVQLCGPVGNFTYTWTRPNGTTATTRCLDIAAATLADGGVYRLVVRDVVTGCFSEPCTITLTVRTSPVCSITATPSTPVCVGTRVELCGPVGAFTYRWTLPNGSTVTTRCVVIAAAQLTDAGVYRLVVIDPATGCESTPCTYTLEVRTPPVCSITATPATSPVCAGTRVELCGPVGAFTYRWTLPNGSTVTTRCVVIAAAQASDGGTYRLVVIDPVTGCESAPCTYTLEVRTPPVCSITATPTTNPVCVGTRVELCGPVGTFTYRWTLPNGSTVTTRCVVIASAQLSDAGVYRLVVIDPATGCESAPCTYTLGVVPPPVCTITVTPTGPILPGTRVELCGPVGTLSYRWTLPNGTIVTTRCVIVPAASLADTGRYLLVVTDPATGCSSGGPGTACDFRLLLDQPPSCDLKLIKTATPDELDPEPGPDCESVGRPTTLTFRYTGLNCSATHHSQQSGSVTCTDFGPMPTTARIVMVDTRNESREVFDGTVTVGSDFVATAANAGLDRFPPNTLAYIYNGSTLVETVRFHTSCSQPLLIGDQYGTLLLVGFNGFIPGGQVTYQYVVQNGGTPVVDATLVDDKLGVIASDFDLAIGQTRTFTRVATITQTTTNVATVRGRLISPSGPECSASDAATVTVGGTPPPTSENCTDGKPRSLVFEYTGASCSASNNPQSGKATCEDLASRGEPVRIVYTGRDPEDFTVSPSGETVQIGDLVTISATGRDRYHADSKFEIRRGSQVLQRLSIHTSCSQPLAVGNQFGSLVLSEFHTTLISGVTLAGAPVEVQLGLAATVRFEDVTQPGTTTLSYHAAPEPPPGLVLPDGDGVKLVSTAGYAGGIEVSVAYDPAAFSVPEVALKLMRWDATRGWVEITNGVDPVRRVVTGTTDALALFAVAAPTSALAAEDPLTSVDFGVRGSYPNPTTGMTTIRYALPQAGSMRLTIHDVQGRQVASVHEGMAEAGTRSVVWNGRGSDGRPLVTGIYMIRLECAAGLRTGKLVVVK